MLTNLVSNLTILFFNLTKSVHLLKHMYFTIIIYKDEIFLFNSFTYKLLKKSTIINKNHFDQVATFIQSANIESKNRKIIYSLVTNSAYEIDSKFENSLLKKIENLNIMLFDTDIAHFYLFKHKNDFKKRIIIFEHNNSIIIDLIFCGGLVIEKQIPINIFSIDSLEIFIREIPLSLPDNFFADLIGHPEREKMKNRWNLESQLFIFSTLFIENNTKYKIKYKTENLILQLKSIQKILSILIYINAVNKYLK